MNDCDLLGSNVYIHIHLRVRSQSDPPLRRGRRGRLEIATSDCGTQTTWSPGTGSLGTGSPGTGSLGTGSHGTGPRRTGRALCPSELLVLHFLRVGHAVVDPVSLAHCFTIDVA